MLRFLGETSRQTVVIERCVCVCVCVCVCMCVRVRVCEHTCVFGIRVHLAFCKCFFTQPPSRVCSHVNQSILLTHYSI